MQLQEGFDIGTLLFPMLILVGLCFLGLVVWLIILLMKPKSNPDAPSAPPQLPAIHADAVPQDEARPGALPFILAIRRSGPEWEIYVKGQRANAFTAPYDSSTRKEAIEALRELARFAREKLQGGPASAQSVTEPLVEISPTPASRTLKATSGELETGAARMQSRSTRTAEPPPSSTARPSMDLAREIGEIVDELIAASPSLQNHAVTLMNAQTKGINFVVDGVVYNSVEDIPDAEVQALIRKATREWERR